MVERGEHTRLPLETRQAIGICSELARQDLERDIPTQPRVPRAIDLAHPAGTKRCQYLIDIQATADERIGAGLVHHLRGDDQCMSIKDTVRRDTLRQQRFHLAPKALVIRARLS